ncbi:MAG: hypothetical protein R3E79_36420 [Caldilineaceae bacterium]
MTVVWFRPKSRFSACLTRGDSAYSYQDAQGKYYYPKDVEERNGQPFAKSTGKPLHTQLEKMSKSKLNIYGLDEVIDEYGADAVRLYELFIGPVSGSTPWNMAGMDGVSVSCTKSGAL